MADASTSGIDGWHLVPATVIREEEQIEEWRKSKGNWSGVGKHLSNWSDHKTLRVQGRELGLGSYGEVERITYKAVTLARKHVSPRRGRLTLEQLREEANAMERLDNKHILKLVGTYTSKTKHLYLLLYPVAVCDLHRFLEEVDDIRSGAHADREDAMKRMQDLGLKDVSTIEKLAFPKSQSQSVPRTATAVGFLQQILGCITEALAYVHAQGIRHMDLKPKNILLNPGKVYLADFGIARDVRESEDSITSTRLGSPYWMAPEVHDEEVHHMAPADIWSLGSIFLNTATVFYGESLESYDQIMKGQDWERKYKLLPKYLNGLKTKAVAAALEDYESPTFNVKHIIGLIEDMLKCDPEERPTAIEVNERLSELGGLDQIYHLSCCHKKNAYVSEVINKKLKSVHEMNADSVLQIAQLKAENDEYKERLQHLEELKGTWEMRLTNQSKHSGDQYQALQEKYNQEFDARKKFEKDNKPFRRPRSQNKGRGRGRSQELLHTNGHRPPPLLKTLNHEMYLNSHTQQRASGLPLPIRPSTPIRPALSRNPGSSSSTLVSLTHSIFSRASPNESLSSVSSSRTVRSVSPSSPTTAKPRNPTETALDLSACPTVANEILKPAVMKKVGHEAKPSWANVVSLRPIR
ncbi:Mitogen-activated protein kinase kinase kinase [Lachnellula subtilissima]|uniref:non-specific serine/threonine protein kinase n=1 Tax=Lachnellula subtilissima TaxID=602034 RepID=A0A8H8S2X6_9HELO|nr:Mitogen-activated protein kinase kinase kinase [Lachnellula subtilissima]